jgi:hypothetical protein
MECKENEFIRNKDETIQPASKDIKPISTKSPSTNVNNYEKLHYGRYLHCSRPIRTLWREKKPSVLMF